MLLEFSCSNFKSIKEKVTFSAIATDNIKNEKFLKIFFFAPSMILGHQKIHSPGALARRGGAPITGLATPRLRTDCGVFGVRQARCLNGSAPG